MIKRTYYIIYNLDNIKQLIISSARGMQLTAPVRSIVESRGLPVIPQVSLQHAPLFEPPRLPPLPSLLLRYFDLDFLIYILILLNLFLSIYIILILYKKTGSLVPLLALTGAPSLLIGATGLQIQEHLLILGLLFILFIYILNNKFSVVIATLGLIVAGLSVPLGPLIAAYALYPAFHRKFSSIPSYAILLVGAVFSVLLPSGFVSAFTYRGFCLADILGAKVLANSLFMVLVSLPLVVFDAVYGPVLWVSAAVPGIVAGASCSLHAVAVLLWTSILWSIASEPPLPVEAGV